MPFRARKALWARGAPGRGRAPENTAVRAARLVPKAENTAPWPPLPVISRLRSAASTPSAHHMPVPMSTIEVPTRTGGPAAAPNRPSSDDAGAALVHRRTPRARGEPSDEGSLERSRDSWREQASAAKHEQAGLLQPTASSIMSPNVLTRSASSVDRAELKPKQGPLEIREADLLLRRLDKLQMLGIHGGMTTNDRILKYVTAAICCY